MLYVAVFNIYSEKMRIKPALNLSISSVLQSVSVSCSNFQLQYTSPDTYFLSNGGLCLILPSNVREDIQKQGLIYVIKLEEIPIQIYNNIEKITAIENFPSFLNKILKIEYRYIMVI